MSELKCCPFCGGEAKYISFTQGLFVQRFVTCTKCGIETKRNYLKKEDAINQWNTRKPLDNIVEKLEERSAWHQKYGDSSGYTFAGYEGAIDIVKQEINNGLE